MPTNHSARRIPAKLLTIGMTVVKLDRPWAESPFNVHGFKIHSTKQLALLQQSCDYVYVGVLKSSTDSSEQTLKPKTASLQQTARSGSQAIVKDSSGKAVEPITYRNTTSFQQAMPEAKNTHRQAKTVVKSLFKSLRLGQSFDSSVAKRAVKQCVDCVIANEEAMIWLGLLKNVDEYTAEHSLNVAMLSIVLGRQVGLPPSELEILGLCGMLHDMGKSDIPLEILNKEGALNEQEFDLMKSHAARGYKILKEKSDIVPLAADVAHSHHERLNGRGYPRQLNADAICYFTRIVAIADAYDAITSTRVYSPAKTALEGIQILTGAKGSHFDPLLVDHFIEAIGIYPAGSVAELSTGEAAIVLPTPRANQDRPLVLVVRDKKKQPCDEHQLDLSQHPTDANGKVISIRHLYSNSAFGINLKHYHGLLR